MITLFWLSYIIIGLAFGLYWNTKLTTHTKSHNDKHSFMNCWCSTTYGDFLMLGAQLAALFWPAVLFGLVVYVAIQFTRELRGISCDGISFYPWGERYNTKNVIVPNDAASAMAHKALKHLVNGCESHMMVCSYKEESLAGLINFSKEILATDATSAGIMRMANLEDKLQGTQNKYNELLKMVCEPDNKNLQEFLNTQCLCRTQKGCKLHGTV